MISFGEGLPLSPCLCSVTGPFEDRFFCGFLWLMKNPAKGGVF
ncbi:hypothetical protein Syncc8109_2576 [Synechococcus sp. WH 8109]|nr:hypothetical protein Syncc8109_2576 [Synechococcus sp. WH 8109]